MQALASTRGFSHQGKLTKVLYVSLSRTARQKVKQNAQKGSIQSERAPLSAWSCCLSVDSLRGPTTWPLSSDVIERKIGSRRYGLRSVWCGALCSRGESQRHLLHCTAKLCILWSQAVSPHNILPVTALRSLAYAASCFTDDASGLTVLRCQIPELGSLQSCKVSPVYVESKHS